MHFDPIELLAYTIFLGAMPFVIIGVTSFVKFSVVLALLRNATGTQNIPPNMVLNCIALVLSLYVMMPTVMQAAGAIDEAQRKKVSLFSASNEIVKPFLEFTQKHTPEKELSFYKETAVKLWGEKTANELTGEKATPFAKLLVTVPAFMTAELTKAFMIGFLLFLPFVVIDLVVANILLALGMSTLSPVTVSLPIKLLLFIGLDGWRRLFEALVMSYT